MDDSWVLKFKAYIIAITLHKHTLKIYRLFGIIALLVLCQQSMKMKKIEVVSSKWSNQDSSSGVTLTV